MAAARDEWALLADVVAMFDATDGEAANARAAALLSLKRKRLKFADAIETEGYRRAIWAKYKPEGLREWIEWKDGGGGDESAVVAKLRVELAQTKKDAAQALAEAEKTIESLRGAAHSRSNGLSVYGGAMTLAFFCWFWPKLIFGIAVVFAVDVMVTLCCRGVSKWFERD